MPAERHAFVRGANQDIFGLNLGRVRGECIQDLNADRGFSAKVRVILDRVEDFKAESLQG